MTPRIIYEQHRRPDGVWTELTGPFASLSHAEAWIDDPPELAFGRKARTLTLSIDRRGGDGDASGYFVLVLEEGR